jgi:hypothetical protein
MMSHLSILTLRIHDGKDSLHLLSRYKLFRETPAQSSSVVNYVMLRYVIWDRMGEELYWEGSDRDLS